MTTTIHLAVGRRHIRVIDEESHWITINGSHVEIDGHGNIVKGGGGNIPSRKPAQSSPSVASPAAQANEAIEHPGVSGGVTASHRSAIKHYTGAGFKNVNAHLVAGQAASPEVQQTIAGLDHLIEHASLPSPKTVYRGMGTLAVKSLMEQAGGKPKKGMIVQIKGFTSSSDSESVARSFAQQSSNGILTEIKLPSGAKAVDVSKYSDMGPGEKETLIARNSAFKIVSYDSKSKKLTMELVDVSKISAKKAKTDAAPVERANPDGDRFVWGDGDVSVLHPGDGEPLFADGEFDVERGHGNRS